MHRLCRPDHSYRANRSEFFAFLLAYLELLSARWDAEDRGLDARDRAVDLARLRDLGVGESVLLWMMYQGQLEHLRPPRRPAKGRRPLEPVDSLLLDEGSSFALTGAGAAFADAFLAEVIAAEGEAFMAAQEVLLLGRLTPRYESEDRVLSWGRHVVKCYRSPSANQETILQTAEELRWPDWFDDPLPGSSRPDPKVRLHDTIKALNRNQVSGFLRFKGDGTGTRVGWEYR